MDESRLGMDAIAEDDGCADWQLGRSGNGAEGLVNHA